MAYICLAWCWTRHCQRVVTSETASTWRVRCGTEIFTVSEPTTYDANMFDLCFRIAKENSYIVLNKQQSHTHRVCKCLCTLWRAHVGWRWLCCGLFFVAHCNLITCSITYVYTVEEYYSCCLYALEERKKKQLYKLFIVRHNRTRSNRWQRRSRCGLLHNRFGSDYRYFRSCCQLLRSAQVTSLCCGTTEMWIFHDTNSIFVCCCCELENTPRSRVNESIGLVDERDPHRTYRRADSWETLQSARIAVCFEYICFAFIIP